MKTVRNLKVLSILLLFLNAINSHAQIKTSNNDVWFHYQGKNLITEKLSVTLEATMRYADGFNEKQQWFLRPSVDYQFTKGFAGSVGYSHYNTYSYGEIPLNKRSIPEDHLWVQGTYVYSVGDFKFTNRLRDENRFVGVAAKDPNSAVVSYNIDHYDYRNRLRYLFLVNYPLIKKEGKSILFSILGDEVFMNIGTNAGKTFLNQNRIIGGFGCNINSHNQIQVSYIHQNIWNFSNMIQERNPTLRLSYITNFKL
jgi:hypothetical protein